MNMKPEERFWYFVVMGIMAVIVIIAVIVEKYKEKKRLENWYKNKKQ